MAKVGFAHGWVELDKQFSRFHALAVFDPNGMDHACFKWLNDLRPTARDDLARRHDDHVELADKGPNQRHAKHIDNRNCCSTTNWRWRLLNNLKSSWQKGNFILFAACRPFRWEIDDFFS